MENTVKSRLESLQLGEPQTFKNITILPLIAPADGAFQYRTLGEAQAASGISITEVSDSGSVPELLVVNRGTEPVLLVDGEELAGAKQNRVLNTSILLKAAWETKIPVSCTEQGRWAYASKTFSESGNLMAYKSRSRKSSSVHSSLEASGLHRSDQGEVWDSIAELQFVASYKSPTSAMSDVYKAREEDLRQSSDVFKAVPNQVGLLAIIDGKPVGADMVSLAGAYARLHPKLVRSYALEGLLVAPKPGEGEPDSRQDTPAAQPLNLARSFLEEITAAGEQQFPAIGHGTDFRYRRASPQSIAGAALVHENEVIHAAFFRLDEKEPSERMAPPRARSRWFGE